MLAYPTATTEASAAWLVLGGTGLFLAGHAAFKATVWCTVSWTRLGAIVVLALLGIVATSMSALLLSITTAVVVVALAATDHLPSSGRRGSRSARAIGRLCVGVRSGRSLGCFVSGDFGQ